LIQWVVEACSRSGLEAQVIVATPDQEIADACQTFGAEVEMTSLNHPSGTDRIAEVAERRPADVYVNVQGDEPLVQPATIKAAAEPLLADPGVQMGSVWADCADHELDDPAVVKVVTSLQGDALYFSRHAIPYPRNPRQTGVKKHIGIYAYTAGVLAQFKTWTPSPLELTESLEQLRFLENGVSIRMSQGVGSEMAVDTPEQAEVVRQILARH
jgi:3-deoxy-manno-octulosonate cytidylyltransferase (CMP-KDO synthetase)